MFYEIELGLVLSLIICGSSTRALMRATFGFSDPVRYSASDRLGSSDLMMSCGLRRCPPFHLLVTYGDTAVFFSVPVNYTLRWHRRLLSRPGTRRPRLELGCVLSCLGWDMQNSEMLLQWPHRAPNRTRCSCLQITLAIPF